jgi:hypothetical protein
MSDEAAPVDADEFVLRRIHKSYFDSRLPLPIQPVAFKPTESDVDGLSVFRERFVSPAEVAAAGRTPGAYHVARLAVRDLQALRLTVVPSPGELPGHAVLAELNRAFYEQDRAGAKLLQAALAKLASQGIVHQPSPSA